MLIILMLFTPSHCSSLLPIFYHANPHKHIQLRKNGSTSQDPLLLTYITHMVCKKDPLHDGIPLSRCNYRELHLLSPYPDVPAFDHSFVWRDIIATFSLLPTASRWLLRLSSRGRRHVLNQVCTNTTSSLGSLGVHNLRKKQKRRDDDSQVVLCTVRPVCSVGERKLLRLTSLKFTLLSAAQSRGRER